MAEALNSLFKAEVVYRKKVWLSTSAFEIAVLEWVHWYNTTRIHSALGYSTPCESEATYWVAYSATDTVPGHAQPILLSKTR